jgi:hypothetical protein
MCICVIDKCLSRDGDQQQDPGKSSGCWVAATRPTPRGKWKDSVGFDKGAKMDSFALVMHSYSSMYEGICEKNEPCVNKQWL